MSMDCLKLQGVRKLYGLKWAYFLVWVRPRVRNTFGFISTGTEPTPIPALRVSHTPKTWEITVQRSSIENLLFKWNKDTFPEVDAIMPLDIVYPDTCSCTGIEILEI